MSDFELLKVPNPRLEYGLQVTLRTTEIGTFVGSIVGPLLTYFWEERAKDARLKDAFTNGGLVGALVGAAIGPIISFYELRNMKKLELYDHCYRHRFNMDDLKFNRACFLGATLGFVGSGGYGYVVGLDAAVLLSLLCRMK